MHLLAVDQGSYAYGLALFEDSRISEAGDRLLLRWLIVLSGRAIGAFLRLRLLVIARPDWRLARRVVAPPSADASVESAAD